MKKNNSLTRFDEKKPDYQLRMTAFGFRRLVDWMLDQKRKPACIAFTAGAERDAARAFEAYLTEVLEP